MDIYAIHVAVQNIMSSKILFAQPYQIHWKDRTIQIIDKIYN